VTRLRPDWFPDRWTQLSLPRLDDHDEEQDAGVTRRWSFAVVTIECTGRLILPAAARTAFERRDSLGLSARGEVALLTGDAAGSAVAVDGRGRLVVPRWLRAAAEPDASLLVGTGTGHVEGPVVLLAPTRLLGGFADAMVGER
jgi:bifunctional DNA-binding transcriptional regulator/antitoxin component of YhaV-PrlF toxin-antitoxin module